MGLFREALDDCRLQDLGVFGKPFTWWNKQADEFAVFERLDRGVASLEWMELMPHIGVSHMVSDKSDHVPINVTYMPNSGERRKRKKVSRFEDMWLTSPECEKVVRDAWTNATGLWNANDVLEKIKVCGKTLQGWDAREFGNITNKISKARKKMAVIDGCAPSPEMVQERKEVCEEIDKLLMLEESMWRQRSRVANMKQARRPKH